ncbi:methyltransferase domain-containing protein [Thiohalobacter sp. IOR34]|uniref:class I SAM-dependent methyltransferase n=1 Tax=Thiohalobacter sp. IOR34 TaxID=3057176 RepID=UPI0025B1B2DB|nr:methyltransferase domain-containing protein [Thiohalobacter sp. IOR34]WJW76484.1 methyltransferase domain-containing protein [Thiohalobacter sp. IOR34]
MDTTKFLDEKPKIIFEKRFEQCPLCLEREFHPDGNIEFNEHKLEYSLCRRCGLKFLNPPIKKDGYVNIYKYFFWSEFDINKNKLKKISLKKGRAHNKAIYHSGMVSENISINEKTKILDVGSGYGYLLTELKKQYGCITHAIEPGEQAIAVLKESGIEHVGSDADIFFQENAGNVYDIICFASSLINFTDPVEILKGANRNLSDGGYVYIQINNPLARGGESLWHPFLMTQECLEFLLKKCGFKPIIWDFDPSPDKKSKPFKWWISVIARKEPVNDFELHHFNVEEYLERRKKGQANIRKTYQDKIYIREKRKSHPMV